MRALWDAKHSFKLGERPFGIWGEREKKKIEVILEKEREKRANNRAVVQVCVIFSLTGADNENLPACVGACLYRLYPASVSPMSPCERKCLTNGRIVVLDAATKLDRGSKK